MKFIIIFFCVSYILLICDSRLLVTEKTTSEIPPADFLTRVTRAISQEDADDLFSKEDEFAVSREVMYVHGDKLTRGKVPRHTLKKSRNKRDSSETGTKKATENSKNLELTSSRSVLVKKPIPKLTEIDYEDDFQGHLVKSQNKYSDSGDNEDEDFNIDDYDFDVNHDEFSGRGKPLEPRVKNKQLLEQHISDNADTTTKLVKNEQTKMQQPTKVVSKRHHVAEKSKKVADKMKEDYNDDDYSVIVKKSDHKKRSSDLSDDSRASEEYDHKTYRIRRSKGSQKEKELLAEKADTVIKKLMDH